MDQSFPSQSFPLPSQHLRGWGQTFPEVSSGIPHQGSVSLGWVLDYPMHQPHLGPSALHTPRLLSELLNHPGGRRPATRRLQTSPAVPRTWENRPPLCRELIAATDAAAQHPPCQHASGCCTNRQHPRCSVRVWLWQNFTGRRSRPSGWRAGVGTDGPRAEGKLLSLPREQKLWLGLHTATTRQRSSGSCSTPQRKTTVGRSSRSRRLAAVAHGVPQFFKLVNSTSQGSFRVTTKWRGRSEISHRPLSSRMHVLPH